MNALPEPDFPQNPEDERINENYQHSGFWRRVIAYCIDTILLGIAGLALGFSFYEHFLSIGQAGRWYGILIYLAYFATLNSQIAGGQTLGKRMLGIQVVGSDGTPLAFTNEGEPKGSIQYLILRGGRNRRSINKRFNRTRLPNKSPTSNFINLTSH